MLPILWIAHGVHLIKNLRVFRILHECRESGVLSLQIGDDGSEGGIPDIAAVAVLSIDKPTRGDAAGSGLECDDVFEFCGVRVFQAGPRPIFNRRLERLRHTNAVRLPTAGGRGFLIA